MTAVPVSLSFGFPFSGDSAVKLRDVRYILHRRSRSRDLEEGQLMNLRLVVTDTGRAVSIRDHILPLLRQDGTVEVQRDVVRLTELRIRGWVVLSRLAPHEVRRAG